MAWGSRTAGAPKRPENPEIGELATLPEWEYSDNVARGKEQNPRC
jgi:hypothetical protein